MNVLNVLDNIILITSYTRNRKRERERERVREKKNTRRKKQNIKIHTLAARRASELRERERERVYTTNISRHIINIVKRHVLYRLIKTRVDLYFCVFHQFLMSQRYFQKDVKTFLGISPVGRVGSVDLWKQEEPSS